MPVDLKKCTTENCDPQLQTRGEMKHEHYLGLVGKDAEGGNYKEEIHDDNASDIRICCKVCGKTTGWNKKDAPGAPGAVLDYVVKQWNETAKGA